MSSVLDFLSGHLGSRASRIHSGIAPFGGSVAFLCTSGRLGPCASRFPHHTL
ncbi:hypothetical protein RHMOL_Rhmol01G0226500 [Rhododendron molle]|uniref:Uncharacterized protein n=1 Tax=Rhododendron molle TaxID=49168 RepID=A0ACC0Q707_RHOML|nr:hypothetical protein RHMOL_Rhmol01G0226500 [Rhododendron molle]